MYYEDRPEKDTPDEVQAALREYGGLSPDGQPIWRLVLAQNCRVRCFGTMNHVAPGVVENMPEDAKPTDIIPDRIEEGEFWIPRYTVKGWILQRWFPASSWGTRQNWEGQRAKDGRTRLLAAWPQRGDYMMMPCGPFKSIESAGDLKAAIRCYNIQQRRNPVNWENYMRAQQALEEAERQQLADQYAEEIAAEHRLGYASVLRSVSESAQKVRNTISRSTAGGVNLGASEKWG
jgi:hypothetical protein